ncbi:MAG: DUF502 domain-containing protein [Pirellulales bacterium]
MPPESAIPLDPSPPLPRRASLFRFRPSVLRGLALILPPVLTLVILVWIASTIEMYLLNPVEEISLELWVQATKDIREVPREEATDQTMFFDGEPYARLGEGNTPRERIVREFIPAEVHSWLRENLSYEAVPVKGEEAYRRYVSSRYLRREIVVPVFFCMFVLVLYFLGKLLAFGTGEFLERAVRRLPLVRSVYSSVKKVTNFVLVDKQVQYKRVVAVEYPRKGIWSIGLVTSDGVGDVVNAAREPCVTVVLPGSPTPITGYCVMVPTRETHDLSMTIDQALQFYVSCGVAVPKSQHVDRQHPLASAAAGGPIIVETAPLEGHALELPAPPEGSARSQS